MSWSSIGSGCMPMRRGAFVGVLGRLVFGHAARVGRLLGLLGLGGMWIALGAGSARAQVASECLEPMATDWAMPSDRVAPARGLVQLPLFDDFSGWGRSLSQRFWEGRGGTSIRSRQAIEPPTVGALTFDAAGANGLLYAGAGRVPFPADTLCSLPIDLPAERDTTVYLSFFFQPGGYADAPNGGDSLLLDFYSPAREEWRTVWRASYDAQRKRITQHYQHAEGVGAVTVEHSGSDPQRRFHRMHIPVRGAGYMRAGFRFRLRNYASIPQESTTPGRSANASHWHVDLLYLDRLRGYNDTTINDVACTSQPTTPFGPYSAVPQSAFESLLKQRPASRFDSIAFHYQNLSGERKNVGRRFVITDLGGGRPRFPFSGGAQNMLPLAEERCSRSYEYDWNGLAGRAVKLEFMAYLITEKTPGNAPFRWNDTVRSVVEYGDAYAYDSGEPNTGYGIVGVGAERAAVAMRFAPLAPTAIRGVRLWFNPILSPSERKSIRLTIWEDDGGKPGRVLSQQLVVPPQQPEAQGQFAYYELQSPLRFEAPVHVGWVQTSADMLNVGYDRSVAHRPTIHYRTTGQWEVSGAGGSLLLRIVCGGQGTYPPEESPSGGCDGDGLSGLFPNPTWGWVRIRCVDPSASASLHGVMGHALRSNLPCNSPIDLHDLPAGVYLLRVVSGNGRLLGTHRLVRL